MRSLSRSSKLRTRSTTRPRRVDVDSTSEPVADISNAGVTIAVRNSIVEFNAFGFIRSSIIGSLRQKFESSQAHMLLQLCGGNDNSVGPSVRLAGLLILVLFENT